jgi:hypothetical protein
MTMKKPDASESASGRAAVLSRRRVLRGLAAGAIGSTLDIRPAAAVEAEPAGARTA